MLTHCPPCRNCWCTHVVSISHHDRPGGGLRKSRVTPITTSSIAVLGGTRAHTACKCAVDSTTLPSLPNKRVRCCPCTSIPTCTSKTKVDTSRILCSGGKKRAGKLVHWSHRSGANGHPCERATGYKTLCRTLPSQTASAPPATLHTETLTKCLLRHGLGKGWHHSKPSLPSQPRAAHHRQHTASRWA